MGIDRRIRGVLLAAALLLVPVLMFGCPGGKSSDTISGHIEVTLDQDVIPLANANVTIQPAKPDAEQRRTDEAPEETSNLRGVSTTNASGSFLVTSLASSATFSEYPLLRGWNYSIRIEAPGYYIYYGDFTYEKGAGFLEIQLEEKDTDNVDDDSGMIQIPEGGLQMGASPKRGV
jgi:hypothetical protein